ncbi:prorelaxin H1 [Hoplias malabaricus]|uniref:prorelaxin H1 n=1 Tax=Hoplias malabaricus TaxID=27720 RepID=UPI0034628163
MASSCMSVCSVAVVLVVCLVCVTDATLQRDYGVKLCGREFIRAVIFTCGGSRWRRSLEQDSETTPRDGPLLLTSFQNPSDRSGDSIWSQSSQQPSFMSSSILSSSSSPSLSELLDAVGERAEQSRVETKLPQTLIEQSERSRVPNRSEALVGVLDRAWLNALIPSARYGDTDTRTDRNKRHFSTGLAGMCCNHGCTKYDIGRLC